MYYSVYVNKVVSMLRANLGGGDVSVGRTVLKSNFNRERMNVGHENGCLSCVSGMRSERRFSYFWDCSLMLFLCRWKN